MHGLMRHLLTFLAVVALVLFVGCGDKEPTPADPGVKTPPAKTADVTYECAKCDKTKTQAMNVAPPS
jgi:hypothetical protein